MRKGKTHRNTCPSDLGMRFLHLLRLCMWLFKNADSRCHCATHGGGALPPVQTAVAWHRRHHPAVPLVEPKFQATGLWNRKLYEDWTQSLLCPSTVAIAVVATLARRLVPCKRSPSHLRAASFVKGLVQQKNTCNKAAQAEEKLRWAPSIRKQITDLAISTQCLLQPRTYMKHMLHYPIIFRSKNVRELEAKLILETTFKLKQTNDCSDFSASNASRHDLAAAKFGQCQRAPVAHMVTHPDHFT